MNKSWTLYDFVAMKFDDFNLSCLRIDIHETVLLLHAYVEFTKSP